MSEEGCFSSSVQAVGPVLAGVGSARLSSVSSDLPGTGLPKSVFVGITDALYKFVMVQPKRASDEVNLVGQRRVEYPRVICANGSSLPRVIELPRWMVLNRGDSANPQVGCGTRLYDDSLLSHLVENEVLANPQFRDSIPIVCRERRLHWAKFGQLGSLLVGSVAVNPDTHVSQLPGVPDVIVDLIYPL
jgi:hypothetical protein